MISLILAVACVALPTCSPPVVTGCATPTPTIQWTPVVSPTLAGYELFSRKGSAAFQPVAQLPCDWFDPDDDGVFDLRICRGAEFTIAVQRYCPTCNPGETYDLAVKSYNFIGTRSVQFSPTVTICMPPVYQIGSRLPYN